MTLSQILAAFKSAFDEAPEDEDAEAMIGHCPVMATDAWREWHSKALAEARLRHGREFVWGSKLERNK